MRYIICYVRCPLSRIAPIISVMYNNAIYYCILRRKYDIIIIHNINKFNKYNVMLSKIE